MKTNTLGTTGLEISPIVFGGNVFGWTLDEAASFRMLDALIDHGFTTIDTADVYSAWGEGNSGGESETILGKWFAARPGLREKVTLFTKVGSDMGGPGEKGLSQAWISKAIDLSLERLKTDHVDLYFSHWPDDSVRHEETLGAYRDLLAAGKIRAIGASNYDYALLSSAQRVAKDHGLPAYQVLQPEYNLYDRDGFEGDLRAFCIAQNIGVVTYFSLAAGFLSGKYRRPEDLEGSKRGDMVRKYLNDRGLAVLQALDEVALAHNAKPAEVALAWLIAREGVSAPIASATSESQLASFVKAAELHLAEDEMNALTEAGAVEAAQ
ncbi:aldo/keto reductase [Thioclava sp. GXIMD4216]|uniref:Aldo/keto reductase n=1 Tax=Thioclava litoralis TaxID=3076557 RepID=A0ABZ1DWU3_9RHOB|nr:aldo/keto reductase [Thioclava sp. FTW29]